MSEDREGRDGDDAAEDDSEAVTPTEDDSEAVHRTEGWPDDVAPAERTEPAASRESREEAEEVAPHPDEAGEGAPAQSDGADDGTPAPPDAIDVEELTGPERRLDPRVRLVWLLGAGITAVVLGTVALVLGVVTGAGVLPGPVVFTLAFLVGAGMALLRYRRWRYEVRDDSLYLERGVVTHVRTVVPYVRIQHVDASRGPVERLLGLSTTVVYTAGSRGADVSIPGLTPERADDLQERLKRLAIAAEGEDAV